ncbi:hypothetical protein [Persicobacter psychrovividus]|uniref:Uncharacterized protein n=1 Tax=Persicobacter psychrovividus TaxID=387638 RepID=A0ABM7VHH9_9BACT|nr:hypothetical protein PEPS_26910 [Persicobacter psychrovividus]
MPVFPVYKETIVLPFSASIAAAMLYTKVRQDRQQEKQEFNGVLSDHGFRISESGPLMDNFRPLVIGEIVPTSMGCIVFVKYRLFPTTVGFMWFWMVFGLCCTAFLLFLHKGWIAALPVLAIMVNYWVCVENFNRNTRTSRAKLHQVWAY